MNDRGRPRKYLTVDEWKTFINNHWRHMTWKVNGVMALSIIMVGLMVAILCAMLSLALGG